MTQYDQAIFSLNPGPNSQDKKMVDSLEGDDKQRLLRVKGPYFKHLIFFATYEWLQ
jgi:hypothetical protein